MEEREGFIDDFNETFARLCDRGLALFPPPPLSLSQTGYSVISVIIILAYARCEDLMPSDCHRYHGDGHPDRYILF